MFEVELIVYSIIYFNICSLLKNQKPNRNNCEWILKYSYLLNGQRTKVIRFGDFSRSYGWGGGPSLHLHPELRISQRLAAGLKDNIEGSMLLLAELRRIPICVFFGYHIIGVQFLPALSITNLRKRT